VVVGTSFRKHIVFSCLIISEGLGLLMFTFGPGGGHLESRNRVYRLPEFFLFESQIVVGLLFSPVLKYALLTLVLLVCGR
jgi:hypothetical protein